MGNNIPYVNYFSREWHGKTGPACSVFAGPDRKYVKAKQIDEPIVQSAKAQKNSLRFTFDYRRLTARLKFHVRAVAIRRIFCLLAAA